MKQLLWWLGGNVRGTRLSSDGVVLAESINPSPPEQNQGSDGLICSFCSCLTGFGL